MSKKLDHKREWTIEEMERLCSIIESYRNDHGINAQINWKLIGDKMESKNDIQCKEKWLHALFNRRPDMEISVWLFFNTTPFSSEEDWALMEELKKRGYFHEKDIEWSFILLALPNRTLNNVTRRWEQLKKMLHSGSSFMEFDEMLDAIIAILQKNKTYS